MPGETAMLQGAGWDEQTRVTLDARRPGGGRSLPLADVNPRSLRFVIPPDAQPGVCVCTIETSQGRRRCSSTRRSRGGSRPTAAAGRARRLAAGVRRCLAFDTRVPSSSCAAMARPGRCRCGGHAVVAGRDLPADISPGDYEIWVHNGTGADAGWVRVGPVTRGGTGDAVEGHGVGRHRLRRHTRRRHRRQSRSDPGPRYRGPERRRDRAVPARAVPLVRRIHAAATRVAPRRRRRVDAFGLGGYRGTAGSLSVQHHGPAGPGGPQPLRLQLPHGTERAGGRRRGPRRRTSASAASGCGSRR